LERSDRDILDRSPRTRAGASPSRTLEKGLLILSLFDVERPEWTLKEIRETAGLSKATGFRLVKTLENLRYLTFDPQRKTYHLGSSMLKAGYLTLSHGELVRIANPYVRALAAETTETVNLTVWTDEGPMIIDTVYTSRPFKPHNPPGVMMHGLSNVHSRVFVAFGPESEWPAAIEAAGEPRTQYSVNDPDGLMSELAKVRSDGLAYGLQEYNLGMCAVGAPVFDSANAVRACMAVVAPSERFGPHEMMNYGAALKKVAAALSAELGHQERGGTTAAPTGTNAHKRQESGGQR